MIDMRDDSWTSTRRLILVAVQEFFAINKPCYQLVYLIFLTPRLSSSTVHDVKTFTIPNLLDMQLLMVLISAHLSHICFFKYILPTCHQSHLSDMNHVSLASRSMQLQNNIDGRIEPDRSFTTS